MLLGAGYAARRRAGSRGGRGEVEQCPHQGKGNEGPAAQLWHSCPCKAAGWHGQGFPFPLDTWGSHSTSPIVWWQVFREEKEAAVIVTTSDLFSRDRAFWGSPFQAQHWLLRGFTGQWATFAFWGYLLSPDVQIWATPGPWASASHYSEQKQTSHLTQPSWKIKAWFSWVWATENSNRSFANEAKAVLQHSRNRAGNGSLTQARDGKLGAPTLTSCYKDSKDRLPWRKRQLHDNANWK